jgi:threonyl-tRNA synthetase
MEDSKENKVESHERTENARIIKSTGKDITHTKGKIGEEMKFESNPKYLDERLEVWKDLYDKQQEKVKEMPKEAIKIIMPDGAERDGTSFETTPLDIAKNISNSLAKKVIVANVKYTNRLATLDTGIAQVEDEEEMEQQQDWILWDLTRPFEGD